MVTRRNLHNDSLNSKDVESLLLDKLILISTCNEHVASAHGDTLKYVHEKPACCNICEKAQAPNARVVKRLRRN